MDLDENREGTEADCVGRRGETREGVVVSVRGKRGRLALCSRRPPFQGPTAAIGIYNSSCAVDYNVFLIWVQFNL